MEFRGKRCAVVGLGTENLPLVPFLLDRGARVSVLDRQDRHSLAERLGSRFGEFSRRGVAWHTGPGYLQPLAPEVAPGSEGFPEPFDYVFLTPGMVKDVPRVEAARRRGSRIMGQMTLFLRLCPAPVIGVTGSSGKSTTTSLITRMLEEAGRTVFTGGNIGRVLLPRLGEMTADDVVVLELSSFQLELVDRSPRVAVFLNLRPNHLDIHGTFAAYRDAKEQIFRHQGEGDVLIIPAAEAETADWLRAAPGRVVLFGGGEGAAADAPAAGGSSAGAAGRTPPPEQHSPGPYSKVAGRVTVRDGRIVMASGGGGEEVIAAVDDIPLKGRHNVSNVMAAAAAAAAFGVPADAMARAVASFAPLEHRLEPVARIGGVDYYNDSIATAPDRTAAALDAFDRPVVLLAGGSDKGIRFDGLAEKLVRRTMRSLILFGETGPAIGEAVASAAGTTGRPTPPTYSVKTMEEAVARAAREARPGDVVLLSPACASFGMFANFTERGRRFKEIVSAMAEGAGDGAGGSLATDADAG